MYTLREWWSNSHETNRWIGEHYDLVRRTDDEKSFIEKWKFETKTNNISLLNAEVVAMIYCNGEEIPIQSNTHYYIMTESGKTFQHIFIEQSEKEYESVQENFKKTCIEFGLISIEDLKSIGIEVEEKKTKYQGAEYLSGDSIGYIERKSLTANGTDSAVITSKGSINIATSYPNDSTITNL